MIRYVTFLSALRSRVTTCIHTGTPTIHRFTAPVKNQASSSCSCLYRRCLHCGCDVTDSNSSIQPRPSSSGAPQVDGNMRSLRFRVRVGDDFVSPSTTVRDLGIYLDCDASMKSDFSKTVANCFAALRQIYCNARRSVTRPELLSLVSALVLSRLDYDSATLDGLPTCLLNRLQSVLDAAARLVHSARKHDHVTPLLRELHWLRMRQRSA